MNTSVLHSTLRELRAFFSSRNAVVAMCATGLLLGLSGPFNTLDSIPNILARSAYWIFVVFTTMAIGSCVNTFTLLSWPRAHQNWIILIGSALLAGLFISAWLVGLNFALFGIFPNSLSTILSSYGIAAFIAVVITVSLSLVRPQKAEKQSPDLLSRLPLEKRADLISLSVSDHYVEVSTTKGSELLLMRLSDAIRETEPCPGLQTHRSHWVAIDQIKAARREADRAVLTMSNDQEIPVSRSNINALKEKGLL